MIQVKNHESSRSRQCKIVHLNQAILEATARLWSSLQRNEYKIDVKNAGWSFAGKAFKEKKGLNNESRKWKSHGVKMNINNLRGSITPKAHAPMRTACFILEAICLGDAR